MTIEKLSHYPEFGKRDNQVAELGIAISASVGIMALAAFAYMVLPYYVPHLQPFLHQSQLATRLIYTVGAGAALSSLVILTTHCYYRAKNRQLDRDFPRKLAEAMSKASIEDHKNYKPLLRKLRKFYPEFYTNLLDEIHRLAANKENALKILCLNLRSYILAGLEHPLSEDLLKVLAEKMSQKESVHEATSDTNYWRLLNTLAKDYPKLYVTLIKEIERLKEGQENAMKILCVELEPYLIYGLNIPDLPKTFIDKFTEVRKETRITIAGKSMTAEEHFKALNDEAGLPLSE